MRLVGLAVLVVAAPGDREVVLDPSGTEQRSVDPRLGPVTRSVEEVTRVSGGKVFQAEWVAEGG